MKKTFIATAVLALSTLSFAGQKSFTVVFEKATAVGAVKLKAGEYKVKVDGPNAVFTDSNYKSVSTAVKVETGAAKYKNTAVETTTAGGGDVVSSIEVGGTT